MSETNELNEVIFAAFNASQGKSEDEVKMDMIAAGATFKNVTRLFNQFMIDAGLAVSKEEKSEIIDSTLAGLDFSTEEGLQGAVAALIEAVPNSTERSAASLVRSYAKKIGVEVYSKPKGKGKGKSGFANKFYDFLVANPAVTLEEVTAYVMGTEGNEETSANVQKHIAHYLNIYELCTTIRNA